MPRTRILPALSLLGLLLAACAPVDEGTSAPAPAGGSSASSPASSPASSSASGSASASADACAKQSLKTLSPGKLTLGTDQPVYEPWFVDDKPENGKGFEGAVAAAVAKQLGFSPAEVTWTRVKFDAAIAPGAKKFDVDINEFSITEPRKKAVDFSSSYYDVAQAVITTKGSKAASATSPSDLKDVKVGAQVGTTSYTAITDVIKPKKKPAVYNNNDDAKKALENGSVDALVVDLPTAFYITSAELDDGQIVGQLPPSSGQQEQFGLVLDKGSPLTSCVSKAVDALRSDGTLKKLEQRWLSRAGGAPVLK